MMRISLVVYTIIGIGILLIYFSQNSGNDRANDDKIRFMSLPWQTQAIAANKRIVKEWNEKHPEMPVEYIAGSKRCMKNSRKSSRHRVISHHVVKHWLKRL